MRAILLTLLHLILLLGAAAQAGTCDWEHPRDRGTLHAVARRAADGTLIYGDGADDRRLAPPAVREWRG